jgi:hypothetical protein
MKKNIFDKLENDVPMPKGGKANGVMKQKDIQMTPCNESQKVSVKGTGKARKRTATWY